MGRHYGVIALMIFSSSCIKLNNKASTKSAEQVEDTIMVSLATPRQVFDGWGAGLSWWAKAAGASDFATSYADLFFSDIDVDIKIGNETRTLPGLNLNLVRYNVGGGAGGIEGENVSPKLDWWKGIDGFHILPGESEANWDWQRDPHQRKVLGLALQRNADTVEFVAHASMWWMNDTSSSHGGKILEHHYGSHTNHLAQTIKHAQTYWKGDDWEVDVLSVEPFNEPVSEWWKFPQVQEGVIITRNQQVEILRKMRTSLDELGLDDILIAASDENTVDQAIETYEHFQKAKVDNLVDKVNVHAYEGLYPYRNNESRRELRKLVGDQKKIWMTEYGDEEATGVVMAQTIVEDLKHLKANAWFYWQPLEPFTPWGMINGNYSEKNVNPKDLARPYAIHNKFFAFAHFTRFIGKNFQFFNIADDRTVLAYNKDSKQVILVSYNATDERTLKLNLSELQLGPDTSATLISSKLMAIK